MNTRVIAIVMVFGAFSGAFLSCPVSAGTFVVDSVEAGFGQDFGDRVMVRAQSVATYQGQVDTDDNHWQIGASVRPAGQGWLHGTPKNGGNITPGMKITCDFNSCGANAIVSYCSPSGTNNLYSIRGEVAITNNHPPNETHRLVATKYLDCQAGDDDGPFDDYENPSPIVLDFNQNSFEFTGPDDPVRFDINHDGEIEVLTWTSARSEDPFLALDRNGDGIISSGAELFGNYTDQPKSPDPNGFLALAVYDHPKLGGNGNRKLDRGDAIFDQLLAWTDRNHDGVSQGDELVALRDTSFDTLQLRYISGHEFDEHGNWLKWRSKMRLLDGSASWAVDVIFVWAE